MGDGALNYSSWPEGKSISFTGKIGVVNRKGYTALPIRFQEIKKVQSENDAYWFGLDGQGRSSLYQDSTMLNIPGNITDLYDFSDGLARMKIGQTYGFIDTLGRVIIEPVLDKAKDYSEGKVFALKGNRYIWIDGSGNELEEERTMIFDEVGDFSEGFARIRVFDQYGFIYPDSSFYIWPRFTEATPFFNQISSVSKIDTFGYVFTTGREDLVKKYDNNKIPVSQIQISGNTLEDYAYPSVGFRDTLYFFYPFDTLTLDKFVSMHAEAIRWAPFIYYSYPQMLPKVSAGEGTLAGRYLFNTSFLQPGNETWELFKQNVLLRILAEEKLRSLSWKLFKPLYRSTFQSMPEMHQMVYLDMVNYLDNYFGNYDINKTRTFLQNREPFFAHEHADGSLSPFRKASAQIDRLILIYEVISVEEAQRWIRKIKKEINKW
jgi:hypothetical protein